jgi:ABC-type sulfate/molybdate transport systems ATPase subunit
MTNFELLGVTLRRPASGFCLGPLDLSWPVAARLCLVGPSGSGKTTLLRLLAGLERLDAGRIACAGEVWAEAGVQRRPPAARRIGFLFQDGALWPHLSAIDHVRFVDRAAKKAQAEELLARVGLSGFGRRKPGDLSTGERQRLALARALAGAPSVLLLDEPLSAVAVHMRDELSLLIRGLCEERSLGLVLVTHDRRDALALATDVAVLDRGRLVEAGPAAQLALAPRTAFTAALLGAATCIPLPASHNGHVPSPFGNLPSTRSGQDLVLALLPGDVRVVAAGTAPARGRVLRVVPDAAGLIASVQLGQHVVHARCESPLEDGAEVSLELRHAPRLLPRGGVGAP